MLQTLISSSASWILFCDHMDSDMLKTKNEVSNFAFVKSSSDQYLYPCYLLKILKEKQGIFFRWVLDCLLSYLGNGSRISYKMKMSGARNK